MENSGPIACGTVCEVYDSKQALSVLCGFAVPMDVL